MLFLCDIFAKRAGELVGAGGRFESATNSGQALDRILDRHADEQCGNALRVACASAVEGYFLNDVVFDVDFDSTGANTLRAVNNVFHVRFPFLFKNHF